MLELLPNMLNLCIVLYGAAFLCITPLKDFFKRSPLRIALEVFLACTAYSILALFFSVDYTNALMPVFVLCAFFYCCHRISLSKLRILFVVLGVASVIIFFATIITSLIGVINGNIPENSIALVAEGIPITMQENYIYLAVFILGGCVVYYLLRHFVIPVVTDADIVGWGKICLFPVGYTVLAFRVVLPSRAYPSQKLMFAVALAAVALLTYTLVMQLLKINAETTRRSAQIQSDARILQIQIGEYEALSLRSEEMRKTRHDLRHQYATLTNMAAQNDTDALLAYLKELSDAIPELNYRIYCENVAVNAVVNYYASLAEKVAESIDLRLEIPQHTGQVMVADICVVMGNLLENAVEACANVQAGQRFICARAKVQNGTLSIVVENSFDGWCKKSGSIYFSRKHKGDNAVQGVGLSSVQAVCDKHNGLLRIEVSENIWQSSALVDMEGTLPCDKAPELQ